VSAGATALLRPATALSGCVAVLVVLLALSSPAAAAQPSPDPSPGAGTVRPDPYPTAPEPATSQTQAPAHSSVPAPVFRPPAAEATEQRAAPKRRARKAAVATAPKRVATAPKRTAQRPAKVLQTPSKAVKERAEPAASARSRVVEGVVPRRRVPRSAALAVALLVVLSGTFLAGAARKVAR
jgi:hypothetical protein